MNDQNVGVPSGRREIEGTLIATYWKNDNWGGRWMMKVETEEGYLLYGTLPRLLDKAKKGDQVRFRATVFPSERKLGTGMFKRPTNAEVVRKENAS